MKNITEANIVYLIEECGEVIQAAGKLLRFGSSEHDPRTNITNKEKLKQELCQLVGIIELFDIDDEEMDAIIEEKYNKLDKYEPLEITDNKEEI